MCRLRRIKCDEAKPACNRCARSRRVCPGYQDVFDLVFRDETGATERRARKANKGTVKRVIEFPYSISAAKKQMDFTDSIIQLDQPQPPAQSLDQCVAYTFVSNFVLKPSGGTDDGHFELTLPLAEMGNSSPHFKLAFEACVLSYLSNGVEKATLQDRDALATYVQALSTTNQAIQDCDASEQDATIAAVLLLGLFEQITECGPNMTAWRTHLQAAMQLVQNSGQGRLNNNVERVILSAAPRQQPRTTFATVANVFCIHLSFDHS
ncbi:hypothetical protein NQ176_g7102 [Zarea fungicola]|uniref:Uncharacterized protein n=1 Tax=Zarea fungicola TaxID=93591 RepID=A0ACC1N0V3_9HYPO|nr:hypothetical protein NQ176_g7102 [Lecanicillium fungicola]